MEKINLNLAQRNDLVRAIEKAHDLLSMSSRPNGFPRESGMPVFACEEFVERVMEIARVSQH